jgi:hypothetical protein
MQNGGIFVKNFAISKIYSNFVPDKICVNGQLAQKLQRNK